MSHGELVRASVSPTLWLFCPRSRLADSVGSRLRHVPVWIRRFGEAPVWGDGPRLTGGHLWADPELELVLTLNLNLAPHCRDLSGRPPRAFRGRASGAGWYFLSWEKGFETKVPWASDSSGASLHYSADTSLLLKTGSKFRTTEEGKKWKRVVQRMESSFQMRKI